mmetsp:Transcript_67342/g.186355  ORF Transcript_67342/g.186355 Transcript_67342/m.186355 type:complete len:218 (-) Transcript_67342:251-904(-)
MEDGLQDERFGARRRVVWKAAARPTREQRQHSRGGLKAKDDGLVSNFLSAWLSHAPHRPPRIRRKRPCLGGPHIGREEGIILGDDKEIVRNLESPLDAHAGVPEALPPHPALEYVVEAPVFLSSKVHQLGRVLGQLRDLERPFGYLHHHRAHSHRHHLRNDVVAKSGEAQVGDSRILDLAAADPLVRLGRAARGVVDQRSVQVDSEALRDKRPEQPL